MNSLFLISLVVLLAICGFDFVVAAGVNCDPKFPTASKTQVVQATIIVSKNTDFGMKRLIAGPKVGGSKVNLNDQAILILEPGVTVSNLIIGKPGAKGIDCKGSCTLKNVWWEEVGTHAAGFGTDRKYWSNSKNTYMVQGGGALNAVQKVFVQQGAGTTYINRFYARNMLSLYVSCGNCPAQFPRRVVVTNTVVKGPALSVVGINTNYKDTVKISALQLCNSKTIYSVCRGYQSNNIYNGPTPITKEQVFVGKPLNMNTCKDPSASITVVN